jgi:hypothetical protein
MDRMIQSATVLVLALATGCLSPTAPVRHPSYEEARAALGKMKPSYAQITFQTGILREIPVQMTNRPPVTVTPKRTCYPQSPVYSVTLHIGATGGGQEVVERITSLAVEHSTFHGDPASGDQAGCGHLFRIDLTKPGSPQKLCIAATDLGWSFTGMADRDNLFHNPELTTFLANEFESWGFPQTALILRDRTGPYRRLYEAEQNEAQIPNRVPVTD